MGGNPLYTYSLKQGIADGFLAPYRVHRILTTYDAAGWRPNKGQVDVHGREIPDAEYHTKDFERTGGVSLQARTDAIAKHITDFLKKTNRFSKTIVFCVDQEHADQMRRALNNLNADLVQQLKKQGDEYVARVTADEGDIGRGFLSKFQDPEERAPVILTTSQLLIHFDSTEEIHTLGHLYESMLKEMRDAAGDSGEFYTPRAVVRFMVTVTDPQLGETILDPAAGTGGFLVETYAHLEKQCKTVQQRKVLQEESIFGGEAKPMPYMLCQMNLLLHGLESPQISKGNSLEQKLTEIKDSERVDVILTNPPFGGEEERGILGNFPEDKQTAETALLFLQLIMRKLRMTPKSGRAGVVVPNGTLFGDGVCARIKQELLTKFNLHTIVRLPNGVFAPYTSIPTNLLFFDRNGPTERVWYYEQPLPEGRKNYTKTAPVQFEEFADCLKWWNKRKENERAWKVPVQQIIDNNFSLDIKNPNAKDDFEHLPPEQLADDILQKELRIAEIMREIKELLGRKP